MDLAEAKNSRSLFFPELLVYLQGAAAGCAAIPQVRKEELAKVAEYIQQCRRRVEPTRLTFICTHNSRRSQLGQIWAQVAAVYYGHTGIETFSGGTEATAFNPRAVAALRRCGLRIEADQPSATNPHYRVWMSEALPPLECFSKVYDAAPNPPKNYCAMMTCAEADEACPLVLGCDLRIPLRYDDPKVADDTDQEVARYDERSAQVCTEMLYLMSTVRGG